MNIKKENLKKLVKGIIQEVRSVKAAEQKNVKAEHRGAKGSKVGQIRTKKNPNGTSGKVEPKNSTAPIEKSISDKERGRIQKSVVTKFLQTCRNSDDLLDVASIAGVKLSAKDSRFDVSGIAQRILDKIYSDPKANISKTKYDSDSNPTTVSEPKLGYNRELVSTIYDYIVGAGLALPNDIQKKIVPVDVDFSTEPVDDDEIDLSEDEHDETDMSNPAESKEVKLGKEMLKAAKQLLSMHGQKVSESSKKK